MTMTTTPALASESPEHFVRRIYARYRHEGPGVSMQRPGGAAFYTARLLDAFAKDTASPTGQGVTTEWDPICNCESFSNLRITSVTIAETRAKMVSAQVAFINMKFPQTVTLTLSRTPSGWRIADVGVKHASYQDVDDRDVESIMALLHDATARPVQTAAPKAPSEMPEDFIRRVYARYKNDGPGISRSRPSGAAFYAASLLDAFEKDDASGGGTIDWDPICDCQDFDNLRIKNVTIARTQADTVTAQVALVNLNSPRTVILTLSRTAAGWRIADVGDKAGTNSVEGIMALLKEANAQPVPSADPKALPRP